MASKQRSQPTLRNEFLSIAATLQERIHSGELSVGRFLPTERELQAEFQVSRSTVRRALTRLIEDGWVQNVPNRGAVASSGFTKTKTMNIALIDGGTYVLRVLMHRFSMRLRDVGYHLVHLGGTNAVAMEDPLQYAVDNDFAGALVWPYRGFTDEPMMLSLTSQLPVVTLNHRLPGGRTDKVSFDYLAAAERATAVLIENGCQRIAVTGMFDMLATNHDRLSGYMKAMFTGGLQPQPRDFLFTHTSGLAEPDMFVLSRRLRESDRPDGILVFQDEHVPGTVETILRCGLRIPEDIRVVTIGDEVDVSIGGRGMTTIALDWDSMASRAIELLLDRIDNPTRELKEVTAPHDLIIRGMCGTARNRWTPNPDLLTGFHGDFPFPRSKYQYSSNWSVEVSTPDPGLQ